MARLFSQAPGYICMIGEAIRQLSGEVNIYSKERQDDCWASARAWKDRRARNQADGNFDRLVRRVPVVSPSASAPSTERDGSSTVPVNPELQLTNRPTSMFTNRVLLPAKWTKANGIASSTELDLIILGFFEDFETFQPPRTGA